MKERPIIFSGPMVRAILDGRKSQTRRVMSPQPSGGARWNPVVLSGHGGWTDAHGAPLSCPYGEPGDRLWVRETWARICDHEMPCEPEDEPSHYIEYRADTENARYPGDWPADMEPNEVPLRWRPSIFMPRHLSRLSLLVKGVRVERLQEISIEDVLAEGIERDEDEANAGQYWREATGARFADAWDHLNGKRGYPRDGNPWVWVVEFEVAE